MDGISPEALTAIVSGVVALATAIGSIVTAIVSASKSASKEQVKDLQEWIDTITKRLDDETADKKR